MYLYNIPEIRELLDTIDLSEGNSSDLRAGQKVWLNKVDFDIDPKFIREPQTIERVTRVPISDDPRGYCLSIDIVGLPYIYSESDLTLHQG